MFLRAPVPVSAQLLCWKGVCITLVSVSVPARGAEIELELEGENAYT